MYTAVCLYAEKSINNSLRLPMDNFSFVINSILLCSIYANCYYFIIRRTSNLLELQTIVDANQIVGEFIIRSNND